MDFTLLPYDFRHAVRRFARTPAFTLTALAVVALGLAASITVFSLANAILLKPLDLPDPDRIVIFQTASPMGADNGASPAMFAHWRNETDVIQDIAAFQPALLNYTGRSSPEQLHAGRVSMHYFRLFGAVIVRGRTFIASEDRPGGDRVVVLSHRLWTRRFDSRADVVGQTMQLNGEAHTIIGVVGPSFSADDFGPAAELWLPLQLDPQSRTHGHFFTVGGRLRSGVTLEQARARLQVATAEFRREFPRVISDRSTFTVQSIHEALVGNVRPLFVMLLGAVGLVLLISCSNVAGLLVSQAASRGREIAVRTAIGAGRARIVQQLLVESVVLSCTGGVIGLGVGILALRVLLTSEVLQLPRVAETAAATLDWRVVAFAVGLSIVTGVVFGLVPVLYASRTDLVAATRSSDGRSSGKRGQRTTQAVLVVCQVSLALVLLIGAVLFMRTLWALTRVDVGFEADQVLTMRTSLSGPDFTTAPRVEALIRRGADALRAVPGVADVTAACGLPLEGGFGLPFSIVGRPLSGDRQHHGGAGWLAVSPGFFEVLSISVRRGRSFTADDVLHSPPVALINEAMARRYWPNTDPIGERLVLGRGTGREFRDEPERQIVGVVADIRAGRVDEAPGAQVFVPQAQLPDVANAFIVAGAPVAWIIRTTTQHSESLARPLQVALEQATGLPAADVRSLSDVVQRSIARQRLTMWLMIAFGLSSLLLAATGIYGLIAYAVEQRTQEIGIRMALGASSSDIMTMVVWQGLRLASAGVVIGVLAGLGLSQSISRMLFEVRAWDPMTFVAAPIVVVSTAFLASWLPARRATRIHPNVALKFD